MAVWLDDAAQNIATEVDTGQDNKGDVWKVPLHPGHAGATRYSGRVPGVLSHRISGTACCCYGMQFVHMQTRTADKPFYSHSAFSFGKRRQINN